MIAPIHTGRGRGRQHTLDEAKSLVSQWQASGQTKAAWCRQQDILPSTLQSCMERVNKPPIPSSAVTGFIQLERRVPEVLGARMVRLSLGGATATAELSVAELASLIQSLSEARS